MNRLSGEDGPHKIPSGVTALGFPPSQVQHIASVRWPGLFGVDHELLPVRKEASHAIVNVFQSACVDRPRLAGAERKERHQRGVTGGD